MNEIQQIQNSRQEVSVCNSQHCNMSEDAFVTSKPTTYWSIIYYNYFNNESKYPQMWLGCTHVTKYT